MNERNSLENSDGKLTVAKLDAKDADAVAGLITRNESSIILNAGSPHCNIAIIEACLRTGAHYLDTALYEKEGDLNVPPPWYANNEWKYRDRFSAAGVTGVLGIGFDPGAVNAFCAYVHKHLIDDIDSIDIMDVNAGDHGHYFATNFDPEVNLREIMEGRPLLGERRVGEHSLPLQEPQLRFFPWWGEHKSVIPWAHDELHSLAANIPARRIEFWMAFKRPLHQRVSTCFNQLGLLSGDAVDVEGVPVVPLKLLKAVLPDPASLAAGYKGKVCIGCLVKGRTQGKAREVFIYTSCEHADCFADIGAQAISYTTAVPLVTAALLIARGDWNVRKLVNVEELDPDPFMALIPKVGLDWKVREA